MIAAYRQDVPSAAPRVLVGALVALALLAAPLALLILVAGVQRAGAPATGTSDGVSSFAQADVPPEYLRLYIMAARRYGIDWTVLAAIGRVECDHGRDPSPSCHQPGAVNAAGAGGPMQFLASTWARYGVAVDGSGRPDRWDPADAIYSAAGYLRASGAPGDYRRAILAYNDASWYLREVDEWSARYGTPIDSEVPDADAGVGGEVALLGRLQGASPTRVVTIEGEQAELVAGDGHLAMIPTDVPAAVQAMLVAGNELQQLPYGPNGHPDPLGARDEDCSSTVNYVLYRAGIRPLREIIDRNPLAQSYLDWGEPGPGRWVTIYATALPTPHVFMTIAGLRLDTSHDGTDVGPNRAEDGPRWRIYPTIPGWAHWSVRHPPGL